ncbi:diguanylate cyclase [Sphingobium baderi]|uniref:diguanylate cyclase n=1 Tax=Sphingobium baderi TaxID=1332080 RepID=UPI002B400DEB|nr:diguanylate cyclase [Sphingobium baderi]WRD75605.1 diguanylate cyclase [Sphingobium baderi]
MRSTEPLPLHHSWPLYDLRERLASVTLDDRTARSDAALAERGLGLWHCDLATQKLQWTAGIFDMFGLERDGEISRPRAVALYTPETREPMERLRAYAIRHRRGFTLDVDIDRADGGRCAMRLIGAPVIVGNAVIGLHGVKQVLPKGAAASRELDPRIFNLL